MRGLVLVLLLASCAPSPGSREACAAVDGGHPDGEVMPAPLCPGACDDEAARAVVYTARGLPMYAGQALVYRTCAGDGNFCHASTATLEERLGAPAAMDFDLVPVNRAPAPRLRSMLAIQRFIHEHRGAIWGQVTSGAMPPGAIGGTFFDTHHAFVADPSDFERDVPLPDLSTDGGREILRNWLACGAPFIERLTPYPACSSDDDCAVSCVADFCSQVGDRVDPIERPVLASWPFLHRNVIVPNCAIGGCHRPDGHGVVSAGLDLSEIASAYDALVEAPADETVGECRGMGRVRLIPGDPEGSLLYEKLTMTEPSCGDPMPRTTPLATRELAAIEAWIRAGACRTADCSLPDTAVNASPRCTDDVCSIVCDAGFADANGIADDGCEAAM